MNNIAIVVKQLRNTAFDQELIGLVHDLIKNNPLDNIAIFTTFYDAINTLDVPIMHISHACFFDASIIAFDFDSLTCATNFINKKKLVYYAQNIPWENKTYEFSYLNKIFDHSTVNSIISSSEDIAEIFDDFFQYPQIISKTLEYKTIYENLF